MAHLTDPNVKARLVLVERPANRSTDRGAVQRYVVALMAGTTEVAILQELVEKTLNIELMERFAHLVAGADAQKLMDLATCAYVHDL